MHASVERIRDFTPADQAGVRQLVLAGLAERFGVLDETLNADLDDIHASYIAPGGRFLVAELGDRLVASGALSVEAWQPPGVRPGRIERISVVPDCRRRGIARRMVAKLIELARERSMTHVHVETNHDWPEAIALYTGLGFRECSRDEESVNFVLEL